MIEQHGRDSVPILSERAEVADSLNDMLAAEMWRDIADAADRILSQAGGLIRPAFERGAPAASLFFRLVSVHP
jgi:hypothetical protein